MKINKQQFDEWLENPVTLEIKNLLKCWQKELVSLLQTNSLHSPLFTSENMATYISVVRTLRAKHSVIGDILEIHYDTLEAKPHE